MNKNSLFLEKFKNFFPLPLVNDPMNERAMSLVEK